MAVGTITQTISSIPEAGHRGVDVQTTFVNKQEAFQDALTDNFVTEINTLKSQFNTRAGEINSTATAINNNATTATTKASEASDSATSASDSATTATTKASEASDSASSALTSKNAAQTSLDTINGILATLPDGSINDTVIGTDKAYSNQKSNALLNLKVNKIDTNITVTVGLGGQYSTINAALEYLSGFYPLHKTAGVTATINLLAGFVMEEQVLVRGLSLGWIAITGADAETTITHTALIVNFEGSYPAFGVNGGGTLPLINHLFNMNLGVSGAASNKQGVMAIGAGSSAIIAVGKGVKNAGTHGIIAFQGASITANGANASGAGVHGIVSSQGSTISAEGANASSAGSNGIEASRGSTINARSANASSAGTNGIYANEGSAINAAFALIQNQSSASPRIRATNGSTIDASNINTTGGTSTVLSQAANTLTGDGIIYQ